MTNERFLVVEDEAVLGKAIAATLRNAFDAEVHLVCDGEEAVARVDAHRYALVLLDWWLPPPTGHELLRLWQPDERVGPIVVMSGDTPGPEFEQALAEGASLILEKPFSLTVLVDDVRALLAGPRH